MPTQPRRRWFQFSLRALLLLVTVTGGLLSYWLASERNRVLTRQAVVMEIESAGGQVNCLYKFGDPRDPYGRGIALNWLSKTMGDKGLMTTVILPDATDKALLERSRTAFPESTFWAFDKSENPKLICVDRRQ